VVVVMVVVVVVAVVVVVVLQRDLTFVTETDTVTSLLVPCIASATSSSSCCRAETVVPIDQLCCAAAYPPGAWPCLEVVFVVKRDFGYFLMQYYITSALFVAISWMSFWISVDAVVARVHLGLVTVLTLTLQSAASQGQLPRVSYVKVCRFT